MAMKRLPASPVMRTQSRVISWVAADRPEWIGDIPFVANTPQVLPTQGGILPSDKYYYGLRLEFEGRMTNPAANGPTGVTADGVLSICERIHIEGYHRPRAAQEAFFDMRCSDAYEFFGLTTGRFGKKQFLDNGAAATNLVTTASHTNDWRFFVDIYFPPQWPSSTVSLTKQQAGWLLDAPNYDRLQLTIYWADDKSPFTGQTTSPTFSAFGSATGSPRCRVQALYAMAGKNNLFTGFVPGRVWRYFAENTTGDILANVTQSRQYNIPRGFKIARLLTKTGVKSTTTSSGNNAYNTLSDTILSNIKVNYGTNKIIQFHQDYLALKEAVSAANYIPPDTGYAMIDWIKNGHLGEALDAQSLVAGPTGDVDVYLSADTSGAANQAALYCVEELRGTPQFVS
jgi:hypothetical protein